MQKAKLKRILTIMIILTVIVGCVCAIPLFLHSADTVQEPQSETEIGEGVEPEIRDVEISVLCVGDVMAHLTQIEAAYDAESDRYDFNDNYEYVRDYISDADVALCNVETTFAGKPYAGYPAFSCPEEFASALTRAGFDVAMTANNHMYDRGAAAAARTTEVLRERFLETTGNRLSADEPRYAIFSAGDVDVAVMAYTYQTPTDDGGVALNGIRVSEDAAALINSFDYETVQQDYEEMSEEISAARAEGADLVILYMHWGEEYQESANSYQREMAQYMSENLDIDAIFASHPHNLQQAEMLHVKRRESVPEIVTDDEGNEIENERITEYERDIPVFYSLGNFVSNQRTETLGDGFAKTEIGCIANVNFTLDGETFEVKDVEMTAIPTWVDRYKKSGKYKYSIIPLDEDFENNPLLAANGEVGRATKAKLLGGKLLDMQ